MARDDKKPDSGQSDKPDAAETSATKSDRADRLAAALRENLKKRKAQARQRKQTGSDPGRNAAD
ncbi:MAG: hypothetical protein AAGL24_18340 [Pseudomonadota bacterium]